MCEIYGEKRRQRFGEKRRLCLRQKGTNTKTEGAINEVGGTLINVVSWKPNEKKLIIKEEGMVKCVQSG